MRPAIIATLPLIAALISATPAIGRDWPNAGGWEIGEFEDACAMSRIFEGEGSTYLMVELYPDGSVFLVAENHHWSAKPGRKYQVEFQVNGHDYRKSAVGIANGRRKGFATKFGADFLADFTAASRMTIILLDKQKLIADLPLAGSAAGLAQVRRCVAHVGTAERPG